MTEIPAYIAEGSASATNLPIDVIGRASPEITTTTTADPGAAGVSLAVTLRDHFPQSGSFLIRVEAEEMLVTGGQGTGAGSFTVTRGVNFTAAVAHTAGVIVAQVVGVQRVESVSAKKQITFEGRCATFRTPGRAGTTGQKVFSIYNPTGSGIIVDLQKVAVDVITTVTKALTTIPPIVRLWKFTAAPTGGTALTKVAVDSTLTSNANVAVAGDASADGTGSTTALTITLPAGTIITEEFGPRFLTAVGYEPYDRAIYLEDEMEVATLNPGEGAAVFLDYTVALANPTTDYWLVAAWWQEYTNA